MFSTGIGNYFNTDNELDLNENKRRQNNGKTC